VSRIDLQDPGRTRTRAKGSVLIGLLTLLPSTGQLEAQVAVIRECSDCEMQAELVVELGTEDGPGAIGGPAHVVQRLNGQWLVTDFQGNGRIWVVTHELRGRGYPVVAVWRLRPPET